MPVLQAAIGGSYGGLSRDDRTIALNVACLLEAFRINDEGGTYRLFFAVRDPPVPDALGTDSYSHVFALPPGTAGQLLTAQRQQDQASAAWQHALVKLRAAAEQGIIIALVERSARYMVAATPVALVDLVGAPPTACALSTAAQPTARRPLSATAPPACPPAAQEIGWSPEQLFRHCLVSTQVAQPGGTSWAAEATTALGLAGLIDRHRRVCAICGSRGGCRTCSVCHRAAYCGRQHQKDDWRQHRTTCTPAPKPVPDLLPLMEILIAALY